MRIGKLHTHTYADGSSNLLRKFDLADLIHDTSRSLSAVRRFSTRTLPALCAYHSVKTAILDRQQAKDVLDDEQIWFYGKSERFSIAEHDEEHFPEQLQPYTRPFLLPKPFLLDLPNASLLWEGSVALSADNRVVLEASENDRSILRHRIGYALADRSPLQVLSEIQGAVNRSFDSPRPLFLLVRHPTTNFFHWITEYLPKLSAFEQYRDQTGERPACLIENAPPDWVTESLDLMGSKETERRNWKNRSAEIERLLVPQHRLRTSDSADLPSPRACFYVRERMLANIDPAVNSDRIFISRQEAANRRIRNISEVSDTLHQLGFNSFTLERMNLSEQIGLFAGAKVVVGVHGAGLTHTIFGTGLKVVEVLPRNDIRPHYFYLASIFGHQYRSVTARQDGEALLVDTERLSEAVGAL